MWVFDRFVVAAYRALGRPGPCHTVVLCYHAVTAAQQRAFARQMEYVRRVTRPLAIDEIGDAGGGVAVTFDDGYVSVVANALPALRQQQIPCALFVPTGSWNSRPRWVASVSNALFKERVLSCDEIRQLSSEPLVTVGSHSVSHPDLRRLDDAVVDRELIESRRELEALTGRRVRSFSFPYGAYDERVVNRARSAGYEQLFISTPGWADVGRPAVAVSRTSAEPDDWAMEYWLKVAGAYRWRFRWRAGDR